jgi:Ca2+-binding EF-hand superfamily protein
MKNGINKIFDLFDSDGTGVININSIKRVAK